MESPLPFAVQVDPLSERIKTIIGNLIFQNADLQLKCEAYEATILQLREELETLRFDKTVEKLS